MVSKVLFTGLAVSVLALAQGGGMSGGDMGGSGGSMGKNGMGGGAGSPVDSGRGGGGRAQKETKGDQIVNRLKLNKDQKTQFESIVEASLKEASPVVNQFLQARNMLATAMISGKTGADLVPIAKAMSDAQMQMTAVELSTFQKVFAILKPNQTAKAPEAFDLMAGIFIPTTTGGRGGGGMGRGGGGGR